MRRVLIYCEDSAELGLHSLLDAYRPELDAADLAVPRPQTTAGAGNMKRHIGQFVQHAIEDGDAAVMCLIDLYNAPFDFPKRTRSVGQRVKWMRDELRRLVPRQWRGHLYPHVVIHDLEAWMLADDGPLRSRLGNDVGPWEQPEHINLQRPPSALIGELFRTRLRKTYGKVKDGTFLLKQASSETVYRKCPSFRYVVNDLRHIAGIDHDADECLSCTPTLYG